MFVDKVQVDVKAGDGGDGIVSFRQEKFIDRGGPDGGDGGDGGDVILRASRNQNTLVSFRHQKRLVADPGHNGFKKQSHGKSGKDLFVEVPVGTVIFNLEGQLIADLNYDQQEEIIAQGGRGGFGNAHFKSSVRQAPKIAEKGEPGQEFSAVMELKMIADVGLVGLPNAGKSSLLAATSNARPAIADYPFTTLVPNLGVVDVDKEYSFLMADIPGLIEGAAEGKGLGDEFLRHIERSGVLLHLIDIYNEDIIKAYETIVSELVAYKSDLGKRQQIVVLTKIEGLDDEIVESKLDELKAIVPSTSKLMAISSLSGQGVKDLLYELKKIISKIKTKELKKKTNEIPVIKLESADENWRVIKQADCYLVTGKKIERFVLRTDFTNPEGVARLRDIMRKMGILNELDRAGIKPGDKIKILGRKIIY